MQKKQSNNEFDIDIPSSSASLVARAAQIMAVIITLGLVSMITSMLVTESLSGDAAQINHAGALRMQAMRVSRAHLMNIDHQSSQVKTETTQFKLQLDQLFSGGLTSARENPAIENQYQKIIKEWEPLQNNVIDQPVIAFDHFVLSLNQMVLLLQLESETKLSTLRLIQGTSLFSILIVAFVVLFRLNRTIVTPLKQLVNVAAEAGKGNFKLIAEYQGNNELGVLARTINQMSTELSATYQDFEKRVEDQTSQLQLSNKTLEFLFLTARHLSEKDFSQSKTQIINEMQAILNCGKVSVEITTLSNQSELEIEIQEKFGVEVCFQQYRFPLIKKSKRYGYLIWQLPKIATAEEWQTQILQTMADIIATAIELEAQRSTENLLIIMEERAVIARELHDSLAQSLSYLKVQMSLLSRKMQKDLDKSEIDETIEDIKTGLNRAYQQLRELLTTFRLKLDDPSIEHALKGTIAEFTSKCAHPIKFSYEIPQNSLSANQEIHLLQIIREALSNIQRHAKATLAGVSIVRHAHLIKVEIWDNGIGYFPDKPKTGHFGLGIMQERATSLASTINIQNLSKGTLIWFEFSPNHLEIAL